MRRLIYILLLAVLAFACRKADPVSEEVDVTINLSSTDVAQTKASGPSVIAEGSTVRVFAYDASKILIAEKTYKVGSSSVLTACNVDQNGNVTVGDPVGGLSMRLPSKGRYSFVAISPAVSCGDGAEPREAKIAYSKHIITNVNDSICDLLYSTTPAAAMASNNVTLANFKHKFSQIRMNLVVNTNIPNTDVVIGEDGLKISMQNSGPETVSVVNGTFEVAVIDHTKDFTFKDFDTVQNDVQTKTTLTSDSVIVFPTNLTGGESLNNYSFTITTHVKIAHKTLRLKSKPIKKVKILEAHEHVFTLNYADTGMELFLTVTQDWNVVTFGADFGQTISYLIGVWDNGGTWENFHDTGMSYTSDFWVDASEWTGDFGAGFETPVENTGNPPNEGFTDDVGGV